MEYHVFWIQKSSCFELFGDGKYGILLIQNVDGKLIFSWYFWTFYDIPRLGKYGFSCSVTTDHNKEDAKVAAQSVVNSALNWSQEWKFNLNADKKEVCPFSTWSKGSTWQPALFIGNQKIWFNVTSRLLGSILDRSLTFNAHLKKLTTFLPSSLPIMRATVHTCWDLLRSTLKVAFHALIHSKLDYAAAAW